MIGVKVILQILIGLSGVLMFYLDYKWYDKRKKSFKKGRYALLIIMIAVLALSVIVTIKDGVSQKKEKATLNTKLFSVQDSLEINKELIQDLKEQFGPIKEILDKKYPNLSEEQALAELQKEIRNLDKTLSENNYYSGKNIESEGPDLYLCEGKLSWVNYSDTKNSYQIRYNICNEGKRTAYSVDEKILVFFCDPDKELINKFSPSNQLGENIDIRNGMMLERYTGSFNLSKDLEEIDDHYFFVMIELKYYDLVLNKYSKYSKVYSWSGFKDDRMDFRVAKKDNYDFVVNELLNK